jgi:hypothetical protein
VSFDIRNIDDLARLMGLSPHTCSYVPTGRWIDGARVLRCGLCGDTDLDSTPPPEDRCPKCGGFLAEAEEVEGAVGNSPNGTGYVVLYCEECDHEVSRRRAC